MPGLSASRNFLNRPMTAGEGTLWLRELLFIQGVDEDLARYSSHSLKATCLSWSAKSCTMTYEERLTQGHHVSPKHGMALLYSREALTEILVKLARVVRAIVGNSFMPDLPRAERVAAALADDPARFKHLPETQPEVREIEEPEGENNSEAGTDLSDAADLMVLVPSQLIQCRVSLACQRVSKALGKETRGKVQIQKAKARARVILLMRAQPLPKPPSKNCWAICLQDA